MSRCLSFAKKLKYTDTKKKNAEDFSQQRSRNIPQNQKPYNCTGYCPHNDRQSLTKVDKMTFSVGYNTQYGTGYKEDKVNALSLFL